MVFWVGWRTCILFWDNSRPPNRTERAEKTHRNILAYQVHVLSGPWSTRTRTTIVAEDHFFEPIQLMFDV